MNAVILLCDFPYIPEAETLSVVYSFVAFPDLCSFESSKTVVACIIASFSDCESKQWAEVCGWLPQQSG